MESRHDSYENLLVDEKAEQTRPMEHRYIDVQPRRQWVRRHSRAIVLHIALITLYTGLSGGVLWFLGAKGDWRRQPSSIYSLSL